MNSNSAAKHTPGPWAVIESASGKPLVIADHPQYGDIARLFGQAAEANARLIAAAPELLDELQVAVAMLEGYGQLGSVEVRKMRAAIAKATGSAS